MRPVRHALVRLRIALPRGAAPELRCDPQRRPGGVRPRMPRRDRPAHATLRSPRGQRRDPTFVVLELAGVLAVAGEPPYGALPRQRRRALDPARPPHRERSPRGGPDDRIRATPPRIPHGALWEVAPRRAGGLASARPRVRRLVRLPRGVRRLLLAHLLLRHGQRTRPDARPVGERAGGLAQRRVLHRARHGARGRLRATDGARGPPILPLPPIQLAALPIACSQGASRPLPPSAGGSADHGRDDRRDGRWRRRDPRRARACARTRSCSSRATTARRARPAIG